MYAQLSVPVLTAAVLLYLFRTKRMKGRLFTMLLLGTVAAAILIYHEGGPDSGEPLTELTRSSGGALQDSVVLEVRTGSGRREEITVDLSDEDQKRKEARSQLDAAAEEIDGVILGKNASLGEVMWNLELPSSLPGTAIAASWFTDRPEILSSQGVIGQEVTAEGTDVLLEGCLSLGEERLEVRRQLKVFPSREASAFRQKVQKEAAQLNSGRAGDRFLLPERVDGEVLRWYALPEHRGRMLCLMILLAAMLSILAAGQKREELRRVREEQLLRAYPEFLSKTQLLLASGLSLRRALERLASDYRRQKKRTGKNAPLGEELLRTWYDMENGMLEQEALTRFGERCATAEYRSLALLLAQNQRRGGNRLPQILETEVQAAFEDRKRRARIAGEKASVRLAFPMGMMLVVVLVVIMVPAMLSF